MALFIVSCSVPTSTGRKFNSGKCVRAECRLLTKQLVAITVNCNEKMVTYIAYFRAWHVARLWKLTKKLTAFWTSPGGRQSWFYFYDSESWKKVEKMYWYWITPSFVAKIETLWSLMEIRRETNVDRPRTRGFLASIMWTLSVRSSFTTVWLSVHIFT